MFPGLRPRSVLLGDEGVQSATEVFQAAPKANGLVTWGLRVLGARASR
jgi:hypothetical protein